MARWFSLSRRWCQYCRLFWNYTIVHRSDVLLSSGTKSALDCFVLSGTLLNLGKLRQASGKFYLNMTMFPESGLCSPKPDEVPRVFDSPQSCMFLMLSQAPFSSLCMEFPFQEVRLRPVPFSYQQSCVKKFFYWTELTQWRLNRTKSTLLYPWSLPLGRVHELNTVKGQVSRTSLKHLPYVWINWLFLWFRIEMLS